MTWARTQKERRLVLGTLFLRILTLPGNKYSHGTPETDAQVLFYLEEQIKETKGAEAQERKEVEAAF